MDPTPISLEYTPTSEDFCGYLPKGRGYEHPSSFLGVFNASHFVHGNSYIAVMKKGQDISGDLGTWRRWRIWRLSGGESFIPVGPPESDWADDNASKKPNWMDIPGFIFPVGGAEWKQVRYMLEFVVSIEGHTKEIGALYFFVIVSTKPGEYRVQMSSAKSIPFAKWTEIAKSKQPWAKSSECLFKVDSLWLKA